ncbi:MAG: glycosyltransferase family 2 protein [Oligoflexia bacterium]|nr:glycosyltransferase family 2 protein [Oligoflexia bacterium]
MPKSSTSQIESDAQPLSPNTAVSAYQQDAMDRLLKQVHDLSQRNAALEQALQQIQTSKSWRLTEPLRQAAHIKRELFPLFRFRSQRFQLSPGRSMDLDSGSFKVIGPSPTILMHSASGVPGGWVRVRARLAPRGLSFYLYYKTAEGFSGRERALLNFFESGDNSALLRLPDSVKELRLDPFEAKEPFRVELFEVQELGKVQVAWAIFVKHARAAFSNPHAFRARLVKAWKVFRQGGLMALRAKLLQREYSPDYQEWVQKYDTLTDADRQAIRVQCDSFVSKPLISVVMPVFNTPGQWLEKAIASVERQLYPNWELCIADDASSDPQVRQILSAAQQRNPRIRVVYREKNGHISEASNSALQIAKGEFVALLDHDDELSEHALYMVVQLLNEHPETDMIYSDEDKMNVLGQRLNPYFKCDWNPDLFLQQNYICHLGVYRRTLLRQLGGFRAGFEGAQDWDLAWRVAERCGEDRIRHIPHVLYHWRLIEGSTAASASFKPYALEAQRRCVSEHLQRIGVQGAHVSILESIAHLRVEFPLPEVAPLVSIIIPTRDQLLYLRRCVESISAKSDYKNFEIIIVDNGSKEQATLEYLDELQKAGRARVLRDERPFNYSRLNNLAARQARGEVLAFLNNDLEVITPGWLREMLALLLRPGIGAVGARLLYPSELLQHAGVIMGINGVAGHNHKGIERYNPGYWNRAILTQNLSGVTAACMLIRREAFETVGGFDEGTLAVAFNDVDLCLKLRSRGYKITYTPYAELYHYESVSRGYETTPEKFVRFEGEVETMKQRWGAVLDKDPYYSPNLTLLNEDFGMAFPPRVKKPWTGLARSGDSRK